MALEKLKMKVNIFCEVSYTKNFSKEVCRHDKFLFSSITHSKPIALINFLALEIMIKNEAIKALNFYFSISSLFLFVRLKDRR